jgi:hypothetical protein
MWQKWSLSEQGCTIADAVHWWRAAAAAFHTTGQGGEGGAIGGPTQVWAAASTS